MPLPKLPETQDTLPTPTPGGMEAGAPPLTLPPPPPEPPAGPDSSTAALEERDVIAALHCVVRTFYTCLASYLRDADFDFVGVWLASVDALTRAPDTTGPSPTERFVQQMQYCILDPAHERTVAADTQTGAIFHSTVGLLCKVFQLVYSAALPVRSVMAAPGRSLPPDIVKQQRAEKAAALCEVGLPLGRPKSSACRPGTARVLKREARRERSAPPPPPLPEETPDPNPIRTKPASARIPRPAGPSAIPHVERIEFNLQRYNFSQDSQAKVITENCDPRSDGEQPQRLKWVGLMKTLFPKQQRRSQSPEAAPTLAPATSRAHVEREARMLGSLRAKVGLPGSAVWPSASIRNRPPSVHSETESVDEKENTTKDRVGEVPGPEMNGGSGAPRFADHVAALKARTRGGQKGGAGGEKRASGGGGGGACVLGMCNMTPAMFVQQPAGSIPLSPAGG